MLIFNPIQDLDLNDKTYYQILRTYSENKWSHCLNSPESTKSDWIQCAPHELYCTGYYKSQEGQTTPIVTYTGNAININWFSTQHLNTPVIKFTINLTLIMMSKVRECAYTKAIWGYLYVQSWPPEARWLWWPTQLVSMRTHTWCLKTWRSRLPTTGTPCCTQCLPQTSGFLKGQKTGHS